MMAEVSAAIDIIDSFAGYYLPHHPAVLKAIHTVASSGGQHDMSVSVRGAQWPALRPTCRSSVGTGASAEQVPHPPRLPCR